MFNAAQPAAHDDLAGYRRFEVEGKVLNVAGI
jgi:hypothetical protein